MPHNGPTMAEKVVRYKQTPLSVLSQCLHAALQGCNRLGARAAKASLPSVHVPLQDQIRCSTKRCHLSKSVGLQAWGTRDSSPPVPGKVFSSVHFRLSMEGV